MCNFSLHWEVPSQQRHCLQEISLGEEGHASVDTEPRVSMTLFSSMPHLKTNEEH